MEEKVIALQTEVTELRKQIEILTLAINKLSGTTTRMDTHIDFVEKTYSALRMPLDFLKNRFSSSSSTELPKLE